MAALTADAASTRGAAGETTPTAAIAAPRGASGEPPSAATVAAPRGASGKPPSAATALAATGLHPGCCENLEADWVTLAIAQGRTGAVPKRVGQAWTKVSEEYEQLAMVLKDDGYRPLLWEFHEGGPAAYTQAATAAGGRAGQPVDLTKCRDSAKLLSAVA